MQPLPVPRSAASGTRPSVAARTTSAKASSATPSVSGQRDQHSRIDRKVQRAEAPPPEHILQRLAGESPLEHGVEMSDTSLHRGFVEG